VNEAFASVKEDLLRCNKCGTCASVCPTYGALRRETTSARGRVSLIAAYLAGDVEPDAEFEHLMYYCLSCHACATTCPNGVRVDSLVLAAREELAAGSGHSLSRQAVFQGLLPHPGRLDAALWPARLYDATGVRALAERTGLVSHLPGRLSIYGQMLPRAPLRPASSSIPEVSPAVGRSLGRVGYFLGCAQNLLYPETAKATVALLNLAGFDVVTPRGLVCCGMPARAYGEIAIARQLAAENVAAFAAAGVEAVITDCASCGSFLKEYGELLAQDSQIAQEAERLAKGLQDVSQFLTDQPPQGERRALDDTSVTYHDPCHLAHAQGIKKQPRDLLKGIEGVEFREMRTQGACCGGAGSYGLTHPEVSVTILDKRITEAVDTGASVLATGCPACRMQLEFGMRRAGARVEVRHTTELLAESYGVGRSFTKSSISGTPASGRDR
jgi:glycolate oxidase iron-sulfur subunit